MRPRYTKEVYEETVRVFTANHLNVDDTAHQLDLTTSALRYRLKAAQRRHNIEVPTQDTIALSVTSKAGSGPWIDVPTAERLRIRELEHQVSTLTRANALISKEIITTERIKEIIHEGSGLVKPKDWKLHIRTAETTGVPVFAFSDLHYDEIVDPAQINGVNAYNRQIADRRIQTYFTKGTDLVMNYIKSPKYDYCVLACIGDLLSGNIHEELAITNVAPIGLSILALKDQVISGILHLKKAFGRVRVYSVVGNHGRFTPKKQAKNKQYDSFEFFVMHMVKQYFANDKDVSIDIAEGSDLPFDVYTWKFLLNHGDDAKGGGGYMGPLGPVMKADLRKRKFKMAVNQPYHYQLNGHWHTCVWYQGGLINGAIKGYDEWVASMLFDFEPPTQALFITHPKWGITLRWPVQLEVPGRSYS